MSSNKFTGNSRRKLNIFESVKKSTDCIYHSLHEAGPREGESVGGWLGRLRDYLGAKTDFVDREDADRTLRAARSNYEDALERHLPEIKERYDREGMASGSHPGEFTPIKFNPTVARNHIVDTHLKKFGVIPSEKHIKHYISKFKEVHEASEIKRQNAHAEKLERHDAGFGRHLENDWFNAEENLRGVPRSHPMHAVWTGNIRHPNYDLVRAARHLYEVQRKYNLATEDLPRFSDENIARSIGEFIHGRITGRGTNRSSAARLAGVRRYLAAREKRSERRDFGFGTPVTPEDSPHGPR